MLAFAAVAAMSDSAGADGRQLVEAPAWLRELEAPAIVQELRTLADSDEASTHQPAAFAAHFGPNTHLAGPGQADDWQALPLMNKGHLLQAGCSKAPTTCAALSRMQGHLQPRGTNSSEVGVRILKLAPGGSLRPHRGPGGRLVAHLGIKIPARSSLTVAGQTVQWREGRLIVFDDSALHSVANPSLRPRYILHIAFPKPVVWQPGHTASVNFASTATASADDAVIARIATAGVELAVFANCSAVATNKYNGQPSVSEPLLLLFNRVADNRPQDWDACIRATVPANQTLRLFANHNYGSVDIAIVAYAQWLRFEVLDITQWSADPVEKQ